MSKTLHRILALILCIAMCLNLSVVALADQESNSDGVTFTASLDNSELKVSDEAQTVTLTVEISAAADIIDMEYDLVCPSGFTVGTPTTPVGTASWNGESKHMSWFADANTSTENLATVDITVPAATPAGAYQIGINNILLSKDELTDYWEKGASATTILYITNDNSGTLPTTGTYNASISTTNVAVTKGETMNVAVNVGGKDSATGSFNACEIELSVDSKLEFVESSSTLNGATVTSSENVLTLVDHGEAQNFGNGVYNLVFTATADGVATVTLSSAAFGTNEEAETQNLTVAEINETPVMVVVEKVKFAVTLPSEFAGPDTVEEGDDYTFTVEKLTGAYYDYTNVSATMDGEDVEVNDNGDGSWTIENVTGVLVITGERTPKTFNVAINGDTTANDGTSATYLTDYTFVIPEDKEASTEAGYAYALENITIDGVNYEGYSVEGKTYTIPGADIIGNIVITIVKEDLEINQFTVTVVGSGAGAAAGYVTVVDKGADYTLTLNPEAGYDYTVTVNEGYEITQEGNAYTIQNVQENITFTVERTVTVTSAAVSPYVTLNGSQMWLVTIGSEKMTGKAYFYDSTAMYWSENYDSYSILIVADSQPAVTSDMFSIATADTVTTIPSTMDVNMTAAIDANDAQLVYNIYMTQYADFTTDVSMEKFLRADVNKDKIVDLEDATAIVNNILNITTA